MKKVGFIKDWDLLQEESRLKSDGFEKELDNFYNYISNLPKDKNSTIGFIGSFGTGKTTLMEEVKKKIGEKKCWQFDAWKYQDKNNLWRSFLLEFADENINWLKKNFTQKWFAQKKYHLTKSFIVFVFVFIGYYFNRNQENPIWWAPSLAALGVFIASWFIDTPSDHLPYLQKEFKDFVKKTKKEKFIFLEDIDRANNSGIHFLETLSFLLRNNAVNENRIIVIATIGKEKFFENIDSYEKCLDQIYFSQLPRPDINIFMKHIFEETFFDFDKNSRLQINKFLVELIELPDGNIRKIKLLLRDSAIVYEKLSRSKDKEKYDWRMIIAFVAMKYFQFDYLDKNKNENYAQYFQKRLALERNNPFGRLFLAISREKSDLNPQQGDNIDKFKFDEHTHSSLPNVPKIPRQPANRSQGKIGMHYREIMFIS